MQNLLFKLRVIAEFVISIICAYVALTYAFTTVLPNIILIVLAIYIFSQALGYIDNMNGYNKNDDNENTSTGNPDNPD